MYSLNSNFDDLLVYLAFQDTLLDAAGTIKCSVMLCKKKISKGDEKQSKYKFFKEKM